MLRVPPAAGFWLPPRPPISDPPTMRLPSVSCRWIASLVRAAWMLALVAIGAAPPGAQAVAGEAPSYNRDVMAVLSKAGCNLGACHGNLNGKGGFRLSLRGENPAADYASLLREVEQRRVNLLEPEASLILQKPTAQVVHLGGL